MWLVSLCYEGSAREYGNNLFEARRFHWIALLAAGNRLAPSEHKPCRRLALIARRFPLSCFSNEDGTEAQAAPVVSW
jgi:hypothetical protein